jgi:hypothetical protein
MREYACFGMAEKIKGKLINGDFNECVGACTIDLKDESYLW